MTISPLKPEIESMKKWGYIWLSLTMFLLGFSAGIFFMLFSKPL